MQWTPNVAVPADGHNHGIVFDFIKLASVRESLEHRLPRLKTLHALGNTHQFRGQTNEDGGSSESQWKSSAAKGEKEKLKFFFSKQRRIVFVSPSEVENNIEYSYAINKDSS